MPSAPVQLAHGLRIVRGRVLRAYLALEKVVQNSFHGPVSRIPEPSPTTDHDADHIPLPQRLAGLRGQADLGTVAQYRE
jgi:hypothetical protein